MSIQGDITSGAGGKFLPLTGGTLSGNLSIKDEFGPGINFVGVNSNVEFITVGNTRIAIGSKADVITLSDNGDNGKLVAVTGLQEGTADYDAVNLKQLNSKIQYGTTDLTAGTSPLETGTLYCVYE